MADVASIDEPVAVAVGSTSIIQPIPAHSRDTADTTDVQCQTVAIITKDTGCGPDDSPLDCGVRDMQLAISPTAAAGLDKGELTPTPSAMTAAPTSTSCTSYDPNDSLFHVVTSCIYRLKLKLLQKTTLRSAVS